MFEMRYLARAAQQMISVPMWLRNSHFIEHCGSRVFRTVNFAAGWVLAKPWSGECSIRITLPNQIAWRQRILVAIDDAA